MEELMNLVAASFIRNGIEVPAHADAPAIPAVLPAEPTPTTKLPDHNYRTTLQTEPAAP